MRAPGSAATGQHTHCLACADVARLACADVLRTRAERLGMAVCYHSPYLFSMTWKAVRPFIDPVTQQKIIFVDKGPKEADMMNERWVWAAPGPVRLCAPLQKKGLFAGACEDVWA